MDEKDQAKRTPDLYLSRANAYLNKVWDEAGEPPSDDAMYDKWKAGLERAGGLQRALEETRAAISLDPSYAEAYYTLGVIQLERNACAEALEAFDKYISLDPEDSEAYYQRAMVLRETGDNGRALSDLLKSAELSPDTPEVYWGLASVRSELGFYEEALDDIARAVRLDPENPDYRIKNAKLLLAYAAGEGGEEALEAAFKCLNEAVAAAPERAELYFLRSEVYCRRHDAKREAEDLSTAIKLEPGYAEAYLRRYDCWLELGERDLAGADWLVYSFLAPEESFLLTAYEARDAARRGGPDLRLN